MKKVIIIPDVHGREFWKDALDYIRSGVRVIFLGDFVDPYLIELISSFKALQNFKDILEEVENKENCILLLGNHDCTYMYPDDDICECRTDYTNQPKLIQLFNNHKNRFRLAWKEEIGDKEFLFSHAGVNKQWLNWLGKKGIKMDDLFGTLPNINQEVIDSLGVISSYRSRLGGKFGSIVWADCREFLYNMDSRLDDVFQVVGHTQLTDIPLYFDSPSFEMAFIDTRECYYLDENGVLRYLKNDKAVEKTDI